MHRKPGRPRKVTDAELAKVERALEKGPKANGYPTDLWTLVRVAEVIERTTGVKYHPDTSGRCSVGWAGADNGRPARPPSGTTRPSSAGSTTAGPRLKKTPGQERRIVFQDESGFSLLPSVRSTWAPKGQTPVLTHHFNWKRLSMSAALCFRPTAAMPPSFLACSPVLTTTNRSWSSSLELHRHLDGDKVTLIWDGLPSHRSRAMRRFVRKQRKWLVVERLPPYAPDLNPVEQIWGNLKSSDLANLCLDTIGEAEEIVDQGLCRIGNETRLAFAFLRHCGLTL